MAVGLDVGEVSARLPCSWCPATVVAVGAAGTAEEGSCRVTISIDDVDKWLDDIMRAHGGAERQKGGGRDATDFDTLE